MASRSAEVAASGVAGKTAPGRSRNMAAIRSSNTRAELLLRQELRQLGFIGYRCNYRKLPGKPDIVFTRVRLAIFIDGAFWHGHPDHFTFGRLGEYWDQKIRRTQLRDQQQEAALVGMGYVVIRFWDFDVLRDARGSAERVASRLR